MQLLQRSMSALRGEESILAAESGRVAWSKVGDYKRALRNWQGRGDTYKERPPLAIPATPQVQAWFEANGIPFEPPESPDIVTE